MALPMPTTPVMKNVVLARPLDSCTNEEQCDGGSRFVFLPWMSRIVFKMRSTKCRMEELKNSRKLEYVKRKQKNSKFITSLIFQKFVQIANSNYIVIEGLSSTTGRSVLL